MFSAIEKILKYMCIKTKTSRLVKYIVLIHSDYYIFVSDYAASTFKKIKFKLLISVINTHSYYVSLLKVSRYSYSSNI